MLQSSITAWLKKPASVTKADEPKTAHALPSASPGLEASSKGAAAPADTTRSHVPSSSHVAALQDTPLSKPFHLRPLPPNVELVPLTEELVPAFKRLNSLLLPVAYPPAFYTESMTEPHHGITLMAMWHTSPSSAEIMPGSEQPRLIGAIRCRILPSATLYISTIGLLSPYRSYGIATHLLHRIIVKASKEHGIRSVVAHVWEANEEGLEWYKKRGFEIIGKEDGYYSKLRPSRAILIRKWIGVGDLLAIEGQNT